MAQSLAPLLAPLLTPLLVRVRKPLRPPRRIRALALLVVTSNRLLVPHLTTPGRPT